MKLRALVASIGTAIVCTLSSTAWADYVLSVDAPTSASFGDTETVRVKLQVDLPDRVTAVGFTLSYDAALMTLKLPVSGAGPLLPDPPWFTVFSVDPVAGLIDFQTVDTGLTGLFQGFDDVIAQFQFELIHHGLGSFAMSSNKVAAAGSGSPLPGTTSGSTMRVIPAPGTMLLVGLGLALLGSTRRQAPALAGS